ncbi:HAMP domain-containing protein [Kitasatospora sp. NPDC059811]|uniref:HAMP domain-containing protein n=1 Tax=Streptomycetaceae TaxID=2062 RepID=UPI0007AFD796
MDERPAPGADPAEQALRHLRAGLTAVRDGDFATRLAPERPGVLGEIATVFNTMADQLSAFAGEVTRAAREVGTVGNLRGQTTVKGISGVWKDLSDNVNVMASNLTGQVRSMSEVATASASGRPVGDAPPQRLRPGEPVDTRHLLGRMRHWLDTP